MLEKKEKGRTELPLTGPGIALLHAPGEHYTGMRSRKAVIADEFHHHTGGRENGQSNEQPRATGTAGESPALSGPDPIGPAVPIPGGERKRAVQDARRQGQRRAKGKP